jgi:hypothetical protein
MGDGESGLSSVSNYVRIKHDEAYFHSALPR